VSLSEKDLKAREPASALYPREVIGSKSYGTRQVLLRQGVMDYLIPKKAQLLGSIPLYAREEIQINDSLQGELGRGVRDREKGVSITTF